MITDRDDRQYLSLFKAIMMTLGALGVVSSFSYVGGFLGFYAGNAAWLVMLVATLLSMCVACALSAFARRYVVTGSIMSYLAEVFGPWARLIVGACYLLGYLAALSTILLGAAYYTNDVFAQLQIGGGGPLRDVVLLVATAIAAGLLTFRGLNASASVVTFLTVISIPVLAAVTGGILRKQGLHLEPQFVLAGASWRAIMSGIGIGLAFYIGFDGSATLATETRNPTRNVPIILLSSIAGCGAIMTCGCLVQIPALASHAAALNAGVPPMVVLAKIAGLGFLALPLSVTFAFASFSSLVAIMNFAARIIAKASQDGLLPSVIGVIHPRHHTPANAIVVLVVAASALPSVFIALKAAPALTLMTVFSAAAAYFWIPPYFLICLGAVQLYRREEHGHVFALITFLVGAGGTLSIAVYNLLDKAPGLLGLVPYISLGAGAVLFSAFMVRERRGSTGPSSNTELPDNCG